MYVFVWFHLASEWSSLYCNSLGVYTWENLLGLNSRNVLGNSLHGSLAGTHLWFIRYTKNATPWLPFAWAIAQGCVCSKQPWGMKYYLLLEQIAGLLTACYEIVASLSLVFLFCNASHHMCRHPSDSLHLPMGIGIPKTNHILTPGYCSFDEWLNLLSLRQESCAFCQHL